MGAESVRQFFLPNFLIYKHTHIYINGIVVTLTPGLTSPSVVVVVVAAVVASAAAAVVFHDSNLRVKPITVTGYNHIYSILLHTHTQTHTHTTHTHFVLV